MHTCNFFRIIDISSGLLILNLVNILGTCSWHPLLCNIIILFILLASAQYCLDFDLMTVYWWRVGQGRFGKVFTAVNNRTGELMAMKEVPLQANDHQAIKSIAEEIRIFEGIRHPNLVRYHGVEILRVRPSSCIAC